jgi:sugar lactone lactonase YvrE
MVKLRPGWRLDFRWRAIVMGSANITVLADGLLFPECPRLHDGAVWFTDGPRIGAVTPGQPFTVIAEIPAPVVLGLDWLADGRALTNSSFERVVYAVSPGGKAEPLVDLSGHSSTPLNELVVTNDGGLLVAPMGFNILAGEAPAPTQLLRVHADGRVEPTGPELVFPNGMVLLDEGTRLVISDALSERIVSIDIRPDGTLSDEAVVVADLTAWHGHADGISVAPDGSVWYGSPLAGVVVQVAGGSILQEIKIPEYPAATSCVLDPERNVLYVTCLRQMPGPDFALIGDGALVAIDLA